MSSFSVPCRQLPVRFVVAFLLCVFAFAGRADSEDRQKLLPTRVVPSLTIRSIVIKLGDVFLGDNLNGFYQTANSLKINTKEHVIRRELRFKEGDPYDQFLIDESARFLRALSFLREVKITTKQDGSFVDVEVYAQDIWTLIPNISFNLGGGRNKKSIGIAESNLLGLGKRVETFYETEDGRETIEAVWDDIRFRGTYERLLIGQFLRSDGYRTIGFWGQPFRSLVDPMSWQTYADFSDTVGRLYEFGDETFLYRQRHEQAGGSYTWATGDAEVFVQRFALGYEYLADSFDEADDQDFSDVDIDPEGVSRDPSLLADNRRFSGPVVAYEHIHPDYLSMNYIDRFERVQDFNLGEEFSARMQAALAGLGSKDNTILLNVSDRRGTRIDDRSFLRGELGGSTRMAFEEFDNTFIRGEAKYFNVLGTLEAGGFFLGKHTFMTSLSVEYGDDLDRDRQLLLGAENGLRGYEDRFFAGDKRFVLNIEDRIHMVEDIFQLISVGSVVFADLGGVTDDTFGELFADNIYSDIGFGLRFFFSRSTGGGIVRVDLAFPLRSSDDGGVEQFEPRLVISTGQVVNSRLRAETLGIDKANVSVGQER